MFTMDSTKPGETLVQCDFDGTVTEEDVSFIILDTFAAGDWRQLLTEYRGGRISVDDFNTGAFAMVKADEQRLLEVVKDRAKVRDGFHELVTCCRKRGFRLVIVSNGLDFYIRAILSDIGLEGIPVVAAQTQFFPGGMRVRYVGPDGEQLTDGMKEAYVNSFLSSGYRMIYIGNGASDVSAAERCHHIFATGELLAHCRKANRDCNAFADFNDIVRVLGSW